MRYALSAPPAECRGRTFSKVAAPARAARMQKIIDQPTKAPPGADGLEAMALRATAWAGEPFLHEEEDPAVVLATGTARRHALDEAIAEIEAGRAEPTSEWEVRFALMLGLERV